jgi:hypothetical protein
MYSELVDLEVADQPHRPKSLGDEFGKRLRPLFRLPVKGPAAVHRVVVRPEID